MKTHWFISFKSFEFSWHQKCLKWYKSHETLVCVCEWSCTCKWLRLDTWVPQHMLASIPSISIIRIGPARSSGSPRLLTWFTDRTHVTYCTCKIFKYFIYLFSTSMFNIYSTQTFSTAGSSIERSWTVTGTWARIFSFMASSSSWSWAGFTQGVSSSMVLLWRPSSLKKTQNK